MHYNICFSKIILLGFILTHINAPDHQTAEAFAFIEVLSHPDYQLIKHTMFISTWLLLIPLIPIEAQGCTVLDMWSLKIERGCRTDLYVKMYNIVACWGSN